MSDMKLFCEICNFSLDYRNDFSHYNKYKCCRNCAMKWAEANREQWSKGWRPQAEDIYKYRNERITLALNSKRIQNELSTD
jgi:hypothetical protein